MNRLVIAFLTILPILSQGQQFSIDGSFSSGSVKQFNKTLGFGIGYEKLVKSKNKLGVNIGYSIFSESYNDIKKVDGVDYHITQIEPSNNRINIDINYSFPLINNPKSKLFFGPSIGLNYYIISENTFQLAYGDYNESNYQVKELFLNKFGAGFKLEFELCEAIGKRVNLAFVVNPEITSFEKFYSMGSNYPWFIGWLNFNLGLKYNLFKE